MGKVNISITFDKDFLSKLVNEQNACVEIHKRIYHLALHPFHLTNLNSSIKEILSDKIAKYDKTFDGILLGYKNIKLLDSAGAINFDSCFIHSNIEADFYIFKPAEGQILNGIVNKKSKDHVGCLVHNTFNVSLPKPDNCEEWIGYSAQIGQEIRFEITFADLEGKLPYIKGKILSLASDDSGFSTSEEPNCQQNTVTKFCDSDTEAPHDSPERKKQNHKSNAETPLESPKKKKRKRESNSSCSETEGKHKKFKQNYPNDYKYDNEISKSHKKHKHKDRDFVENITLPNNKELTDSIYEVKVKKKQKHRKNSNPEDDIITEMNVDEKQEYSENVSVIAKEDILSASVDCGNSFTTKKKKKKNKYPQEDYENNFDGNESFEKHKKKKRKQKKSEEVFVNNDESEVFLNHEAKKFSENILDDNESELRTRGKKKTKRKRSE